VPQQHVTSTVVGTSRNNCVAHNAAVPFIAARTCIARLQGASSDGTAWHSDTSPPVAPYGIYDTLNWPKVGEASLGKVMDSISASGVTALAAQMDCWWYPISNVSLPPNPKTMMKG